MTDSAPTLTWLQERTEFGQLPQDVLTAIAAQATDFVLPEGKVLFAGAEPDKSVYILRRGQLEYLSGKSCFLPGTVINLGALIVDVPLTSPLKALSDCALWRLSEEAGRDLLRNYPVIGQLFSQQLAQEVKELSAQLSFEQERQRILRPYLVPAAKRAIMGKSRYAQKLRSQIHTASETAQAVLVFGEPIAVWLFQCLLETVKSRSSGQPRVNATPTRSHRALFVKILWSVFRARHPG